MCTVSRCAAWRRCSVCYCLWLVGVCSLALRSETGLLVLMTRAEVFSQTLELHCQSHPGRVGRHGIRRVLCPQLLLHSVTVLRHLLPLLPLQTQHRRGPVVFVLNSNPPKTTISRPPRTDFVSQLSECTSFSSL